MIEANEDITLVVEEQLRDVRNSQEQAKILAEEEAAAANPPDDPNGASNGGGESAGLTLQEGNDAPAAVPPSADFPVSRVATTSKSEFH